MPRAHRRDRFHRHRPPHALSRSVRRPAGRRPARPHLAELPGRRPRDPARAASAATSPSRWACSASRRCWSGPSAPTSPSTGPGWSATASTAPPCTSARACTPRRFVCTTDDDMRQIASFYTGAMARARRDQPRHRWWRRGVDLVLIGANDPEAMLRHTDGVPRARAAVRRRPVAAARPDGRPGDPAARRRRAATCSPTTTSGSCCCRRPAGPRRRSRTGSTSGSPRSARTAWRSIGSDAGDRQGRRRPGDRQGRPDRRRRRLPRRLPGRAWPAGWRWSAPRSSAR